MRHLLGLQAEADELGALMVSMHTRKTPSNPFMQGQSNPQSHSQSQSSMHPASIPGGGVTPAPPVCPHFDWPFLVGVVAGVEGALPVMRKPASPPRSRRATRESAGMPQVRATQIQHIDISCTGRIEASKA